MQNKFANGPRGYTIACDLAEKCLCNGDEMEMNDAQIDALISLIDMRIIRREQERNGADVHDMAKWRRRDAESFKRAVERNNGGDDGK